MRDRLGGPGRHHRALHRGRDHRGHGAVDRGQRDRRRRRDARRKGDLRRLLAWLRDIESFMKRRRHRERRRDQRCRRRPPTSRRVRFDDVDFSRPGRVPSGRCEIRMPPAYLDRFQKEVNWKAPDAQAQAAALARTLRRRIRRGVPEGRRCGARRVPQPAAAEPGCDAVPGHAAAVHEGVGPVVSVRQLPRDLPRQAPEGTEDRFYWTRDAMGRKPDVHAAPRRASRNSRTGACSWPTSSSTRAGSSTRRC